MNLRPLHTIALVAGVALPILITILAGLARLLAAMGDESGAAAVDRIALAAATLWVVFLIMLVLLNALRAELPAARESAEFTDSSDET